MLSFHIKFVQTDRRTTVKQYALIFQYVGIKILRLVKFKGFEETLIFAQMVRYTLYGTENIVATRVANCRKIRPFYPKL